jgi:hypothetical protein
MINLCFGVTPAPLIKLGANNNVVMLMISFTTHFNS